MNDNKKELKPPIKAPIVPNKKLIHTLKKTQPESERPMSVFNENTLREKSVIIGSSEIENKVATAKKRGKGFWIKLSLGCASIIVALIVLLLFLLPMPYRPADINVEFNVSMSLIPEFEEDPLTGEMVKKKLFPGETLKATFKITSTATEENAGDIFVRMRSYSICEENYYSNLFWLDLYNDDDWYLGADNFYYYKHVLSPNTTIDAIKGITLRTDTVTQELGGKTIRIVLEADALQAEYQAIFEIWPTAPYIWAKLFEGVYNA